MNNDTPNQFEVVREFPYIERLCPVISVVRDIIVNNFPDTKINHDRIHYIHANLKS